MLQGRAPPPRHDWRVHAKAAAVIATKISIGSSNTCDETNLPTRKMAANEIPNAAADGPSSAPDAPPAAGPSRQNNGHRGKRGGGGGRGNDKQKRKHGGFGSAKCVAACHCLVSFPCRH